MVRGVHGKMPEQPSSLQPAAHSTYTGWALLNAKPNVSILHRSIWILIFLFLSRNRSSLVVKTILHFMAEYTCCHDHRRNDIWTVLDLIIFRPHNHEGQLDNFRYGVVKPALDYRNRMLKMTYILICPSSFDEAPLNQRWQSCPHSPIQELDVNRTLL